MAARVRGQGPGVGVRVGVGMLLEGSGGGGGVLGLGVARAPPADWLVVYLYEDPSVAGPLITVLRRAVFTLSQAPWSDPTAAGTDRQPDERAEPSRVESSRVFLACHPSGTAMVSLAVE